MENVNKFKIFTIAIICTFIFAVAAIYTNTKDVTEEKGVGSTTQTDNSYTNYNSGSSAEIEDLRQKVEELSSRIDNTDRQSRSNSSTTELKCRIAGTLNSRGMEEMSPSAAVNDAKINNNDLVVLCSF